jgi:hypothetical protein
MAMARAFLVLVTLALVAPEGQWRLVYFNWLIGIAVGGYVAARRGKTTGWSNSLLVGVFAQLVIVAQVIDERDLLAGLRELLIDPSESWPKLMAILLTIPAALAGGLAWSRKRQ